MNELTVRHDQAKNECSIRVQEKFDYSIHKEFRNAYSSVSHPKTHYRIDLSSTIYIDSSALGMLLLAKEHADKLGGAVTLTRPSEAAMKILAVANFDKIFNII